MKTMRYEVLGPLRVRTEDDEVQLTAPKAEALLATLLIRAGQVVLAGQLKTELWGENPPRRVTASLHVQISQVRQALRRLRPGESPIVTTSGGYRLDLGADELDFWAFEKGAREGERLLRSGCVDTAAARLEEALEIWRGPALCGIEGGSSISSFVTWFEEYRLECLEQLIEAKLRLGRHRETVCLLYSLVAEHPLREAFQQQLMLALYQSQRQADAVLVYQRARAVIRAELGIEPCRALRDLYQCILAEDVVNPGWAVRA